MKEHNRIGVPNKSMRNLNAAEDDTLPIYKRKTNRKGPVKLTDNSYSNRPNFENLTSKKKDENLTMEMSSGNENINNLNKGKFSKVKSTRMGRQQNDFRINKGKANVKMRTSTANNRRAPTNSTLSSKYPRHDLTTQSIVVLTGA